MFNQTKKLCASNTFLFLLLWILVTEKIFLLTDSLLITQERNIDTMDRVAIRKFDDYDEQVKFKRSAPKVFSPLLTTVPTPILTTVRYFNKSYHQHQINFHHRNYELDLERDHALPTSAPNADILKSNSNPTYPNPNRYYNHDRDRHRLFANTTIVLPPIIKNINPHNPGIFLQNGEHMAQPPGRSFFTPPLPPGYQHPFADKPTLRGSNSDIIVTNSATYINRRPIPPPSLVPGHERIPLRPPDFSDIENTEFNKTSLSKEMSNDYNNTFPNSDVFDKKRERLNLDGPFEPVKINQDSKEVIPSIRRILSGSNEKKIEIPEVLLKQVTKLPVQDTIQPTTSPVLFLENNQKANESAGNVNNFQNKINSFSIPNDTRSHNGNLSKNFVTYNGQLANISLINSEIIRKKEVTTISSNFLGETKAGQTNIYFSSTPSIIVSSSYTTWSIAWNIHIYLSVVLFTILSVYSSYKMMVYNKLTFLFSQSYFICINLLLVSICFSRIFYLCFDAYNLQDSFSIFISESLLNLPATLLTTTFAVLILFLFLKSLNHKNNRYSALIRPLTIVIGCGVHIVLCITLHYVESYTNQNQQKYLYQQQIHNQRKLYSSENMYNEESNINANQIYGTIGKASYPPARVLSLICQIIYIFVCLSLGFLYIYLYRILKRVLQSKSQNYVHGYQTLSYGIHITIATALLFVLLGALQVFGAISICTNSVTKISTQMDWLQWGYQFSLRLVEIAIVTLLSWVTGLKINSTRTDTAYSNNSVRTSANNRSVFTANTRMHEKEKRDATSYNQNNLQGFFFPCTSKTSNDQIEADYPAVCNTNTNIHNYTLRTGKLIYDDNFALNSFRKSNYNNENVPNHAEFQLAQSSYQCPYNESFISNKNDINTQNNFNQNQISRDCSHYSECLTENLDHYENPDFNLEERKLDVEPETIAAKNTSLSIPSSKLKGINPKVIENWYAEPMETHLEQLDQSALNGADVLRFSANRESKQNSKGNIFNKDIKKNANMRQHHDKNKHHYCGLERFPIRYNSMERPFKKDCVTQVLTDVKPSTSASLSSSFRNERRFAAQTINCGENFETKANKCDLAVTSFIKKSDQLDAEPDILLKQTKSGRYIYFQKQDNRQQISDDDDIISGSNVECTNLINDEDGSYNSSSPNEIGKSCSSSLSGHLNNRNMKPYDNAQCRSHSNFSNIKARNEHSLNSSTARRNSSMSPSICTGLTHMGNNSTSLNHKLINNGEKCVHLQDVDSPNFGIVASIPTNGIVYERSVESNT